jgi:alkylation response protein AidB-like acyl-CoA dehydrogenase
MVLRSQSVISKLLVSELANEANEANPPKRLHAGHGFMDDNTVTCHYRRARILTIGEGTSE